MEPREDGATTTTTPRKARRPDRSTLLSLGMVAGAAAIAWYGWGSGVVPRPAPAATQVPLTASATPGGTPAPLPSGALPTRLVIPSAGVDTAVAEVGVVLRDGRSTWETAWAAAGHHIDSARPGQPGNVVLTGHVSVADRRNVAVFEGLDRVQAGDIVEIQAGGDAYRYEVTGTEVVGPDATRVLRSDHQARVTLITCTPDLKHRLVVTGRLIS